MTEVQLGIVDFFQVCEPDGMLRFEPWSPNIAESNEQAQFRSPLRLSCL